MGTLKRLIQGQDLAFDTHQAGDAQPVHVDHLHLEKRLHKGGKIRINFFGNQSLTMTEGLSGEDLQRVLREVRSKLKKEPQLVERLGQIIAKQLTRFRQGNVTPDLAEEAAKNIAEAFDLGAPMTEKIVRSAGNQIISFSTLHASFRPGAVVEIIQMAESVSIQKPKGGWSKWRESPHPRFTN